MNDLQPGVLLTHAFYNPTELDAETIRLALDLGWGEEIACNLARLYFDDPYDTTFERTDALHWTAEEAIDWLDATHAPDGYWVGHDVELGALGVWSLDSGETNSDA